MTKRMLIDASHPEETRVVIVSGNRLEELDFESANKKQLKGNIYLAKVTRVEPSLQAAFVDYGGNRHGFLAFGEIHPDYYKVPVADREKLLAEEAKLQSESAPAKEDVPPGTEVVVDEDDEDVEVVGGDEAEEMGRRRRLTQRYKIQEVVKRRQILLVQVVKEERGNKGAALTTYISLAGRYCVLMPNTARGGGVSRKITNLADRRRLKKFINDLEIPDGMGVILRTAGSERSRSEIKRDYEYLARTWEEIRETTLQSTAPALIYEEANLIRRSIRDLYSRDIDEVLVDGAEGYRIAKDFMKRLTPSHAKRVQPYKEDDIPLLHRYQVESQIDQIYNPQIQLKSGGYIVFNPTEALVSIDVNSGKATKERHIEETAYKTNLEAADEIARQLRLRDLAGLIVIDFIDMEEQRNQVGVERRLKEALRIDRARIQVGRISAFGLLEMSRQRLRPSLVETSMLPCVHCQGIGYVRSTESMALHVLRAIEEEGIRQRASEINVAVTTQVALYVLNIKRAALAEIENRYSFHVNLLSDDSLIPPDLRIERVHGRIEGEGAAELKDTKDVKDIEEVAEEPRTVDTRGDEGDQDEESRGRRRRRPRRKRREKSDGEQPAKEAEKKKAQAEDTSTEDGPEAAEDDGTDHGEDGKRRRRRGRRGGRRRRRSGESAADTRSEDTTDTADDGVSRAASAQDGDSRSANADDGDSRAANEDGGDDRADQADSKTAADTDAPEEEKRGEKPAPAESAAEDVDDLVPAVAKAETAPVEIGDDEGDLDEQHAVVAPSEDEEPDTVDSVPPQVASGEAPAAAPAKQPQRRGWWRPRESGTS